MAYSTFDDGKEAGFFGGASSNQTEPAKVDIDAPAAGGHVQLGISDRIAADAAFAGMSEEQVKTAQHELEIAKNAIARGDFKAVANMQFTDPGTAKMAQQMAAEEQGRQEFQQDAMGVLGGVATGGLLGGFFGNEDKMRGAADVGTGIAAGGTLATLGAGVPIIANGAKSLVRHDDDGRTPEDLSFLQTPNVPNVRSASVEKDVGSYTRAPRT